MGNDEPEFWRSCAGQLERLASLMMLIVAESSGSSPGRAGFKMIVTPDEIFGSVGGGVMEVKLVEQARAKLTESDCPRARIFELVHQSQATNSSGMICSGRQTVIALKLTPADLPSLIELIRAPQLIGIRITPAGLETSTDVPPTRTRFKTEPDGGFFYEEALGRRDSLFIVGGGHCALALSELMSKLNFRIELFDDRSDLNTIEKNHFADIKTIIASYDEIAAHIQEGDDIYVVVMTLGYKFDEIVIKNLCGKRFRYFGVLGSRAKMATLLTSLRKEGFDDEYLNSIRTPIGLPINSRTPDEIAVSIAAEMIKVRNS